MLKNNYFLPDYSGWQKFNGGQVPYGYECRAFIHCGLMIRPKSFLNEPLLSNEELHKAELRMKEFNKNKKI